MSAISIKQLLEAGVHFGHQTHRWNPKMKDYIFGERNGIYIIDLQQTLRLFKDAVDFVTRVSASGKSVLFVGTKRQAQEAVEEEATRCGMFFVNNRWLGGLLTNFTTITNSIKRYKELDAQKADGFYTKLSKKEAARLERERKKLEKNLRGIREMDRLPGAIFVVDCNREDIAVREANKLGIPVVAIVDTNSDPSLVDYPIPGNDDALRALRLFTSTIANAIEAGRAVYDAKVEAEMREAREKAAKEAAQRRAERKAREEAERARKEAEAAKAAAKAAAAKAAVKEESAEKPEAAEAAAEKPADEKKPAAKAEAAAAAAEKPADQKKPAAKAEAAEDEAAEAEAAAEAKPEEPAQDESAATEKAAEKKKEAAAKPRKAKKPPKSKAKAKTAPAKAAAEAKAKEAEAEEEAGEAEAKKEAASAEDEVETAGADAAESAETEEAEEKVKG